MEYHQNNITNTVARFTIKSFKILPSNFPHSSDSSQKTLWSKKAQKRSKRISEFPNFRSPEETQLDVADRPAPAAGPPSRPSAHSLAPRCSRHPSSPYHWKSPFRCHPHCRSHCWRFAHSRRMGWECQTEKNRETSEQLWWLICHIANITQWIKKRKR